ncbi:mediator of RNA polymerase II transcription subunit 23-like isoform X1 [Varroa jacobsoni]|uniref:mediator of RNA polymerase II transcription subunit 23-like isoform X1 n=1 Tax=Varroa jacobsoni TaxID=62625 RepID=UPI000BF9ED7A|nr:mediator of RNA polymerase II transcription subunit 23-like isoform X1 [Varroa jacobsoni]
MGSVDAVNSLVAQILRRDTLEEAFNAFIVHKEPLDGPKGGFNSGLVEELSVVLSNPTDTSDAALRTFVSLATQLRSHKQLAKLLTILEQTANEGKVYPRQVCEAVMGGLDFQHAEFWVQALGLVERLLPKLDYKGCRDVLKLIFEKTQRIPSTVNLSCMRQLQVLESVAELLLDRDQALCPSYLVLDDVQKRLVNKDWPHWKIARLVSSFVDSFRPVAQLVTIVGRSRLVPVVGHSAASGYSWQIDRVYARFSLKGQLPYSPEATRSQTNLLRYVLAQPYSREMVCAMLGLNKQQKQRCIVLEKQLIELIVTAMRRSEVEPLNSESLCQFWQNISSQLIYFVLFQYISFPDLVIGLHTQLAASPLRKGRDQLMWVLLQFISGSIQKNSLNDFLPVLRLYDLLYPESEPLPFPDVTDPSCTHKLAVTCIWVHLMKKAQGERGMQRPVPQALSVHLETLQQALSQHQTSDYWTSLLCNAYSTNVECFSRPMGVLVEAIQGSSGGHATATQPLSMGMLDSLTVHTKMSLIHNIVTHFMKVAPTPASKQLSQNQQNQPQQILSPALVETYSRLLVYNEIESLGIKGFMSHVLPHAFRQQAWAILHTLLEMFSYRLHHIQPHYRIQLLSHLHMLAAVPQSNQTQLHVCMESTALRLITGLGSGEVQPQLSRFQAEPKSLLSLDSEELNKALILSLARAIHVTGSESLSTVWCKDLLQAALTNTPHSWSSLTLDCFPSSLAEFLRVNQSQRENKAQLKRSVEEEYRKWKTMSNENDIVAHFSQSPSTSGQAGGGGTNPHLFVCLLWKMLLENDRIPPLAYKILDRLGARALSLHVRTFADFLVYEVSTCGQDQMLLNKSIDAVSDLIWKCYVIPLDRLILTLALRPFEGNEQQVGFFIIQRLLISNGEFKSRVYDFVKENSPEHWTQSDWHERHQQFQRKYPEKFFWENLPDSNQPHHYLPVYFGNICLRFLPVMDIVIHRLIELPVNNSTTVSVESLLDHLGLLYRFHDRPLTYLYNTLHYYESKLRERFGLRIKLVSAITGRMNECPLSDYFRQLVSQQQQSQEQKGRPGESGSNQSGAAPPSAVTPPDMDYYRFILQRIVEAITGKKTSPVIDWRFNEFSNGAAHTLHVTCIELMALPVAPAAVANGLLDVILLGHSHNVVPRDALPDWINAIGLVLTALPESYWAVLNDRILKLIETLPPTTDIFQYMDLAGKQKSYTESSTSYVVALVHAVWYHASIGQLSQIPVFIKDRLKPVIRTEEQMLVLCQLVAPFFQRISLERTRSLMEITRELYEILENVDKAQSQLRYMDNIVDLFYHIKYMFTGDSVKADVDHVIRNLRPDLQLRLRFITHLNVGAQAGAAGSTGTDSQTGSTTAGTSQGQQNMGTSAGQTGSNVQQQ